MLEREYIGICIKIYFFFREKSRIHIVKLTYNDPRTHRHADPYDLCITRSIPIIVSIRESRMFRSRDISGSSLRPQIQETNVSDLRRRASAFARSLLIVRLCSPRCRTSSRYTRGHKRTEKLKTARAKGGRALNKITRG